MKKRWKMLAAILGGAMLLSSGYEGTPVRAEENSQQETETAGNSETEKPAVQKATDLEWNEKGQGIFTNPNGTCGVRVYVYCPDGSKKTFNPGGTIGGGRITFDLYHYISEPGAYTFEVYLENNSGSSISERSEEFTYVKPDTQFPTPVVSVTKEGVVSCALPESEGAEYVLGTDYGFSYKLMLNGRVVTPQIGTNESTFDLGRWMRSGGNYTVSACIISRNIAKYVDSKWTDPIPVDPDAQVSGQEEEEHTRWEPSEEELKLYAVCGTEDIEFTADAGNTYEVTIENSIQGLMCYASFEAVLGDYTIGRTYNIYPSERGKVFQMEDKARITMTIPEALQADGRTFRMISVTEGGRPIVLEDLDSNAETITFETDTYYAFALVYRDGIKGKAKTR